ncbi:MAG: DUF2339 domain-containing protein, partial [Proteobacteria bacterium]|nr:DUF2339 domain-containing protein [Pseudomonadota bacterium]
MTFLWMFVGSVLGGWLSWVVFDGEVGLTGTLFGALFGLLFARTLRLGRRLDELESRVRHLTADATAPVVESPRTQTPATPGKAPPAQPVAIPIPSRAHLDTVIDLRVAATRRNADADTSAVLHPYPLPSKPVPRTAPPALLWIKRWLSEGNPLVKAGIVVVFFGVAYLFKYAAEAGWLTVPVEFRFLGVSLVALAALAFAWHKRESHRAFALSLQGGAIGVLILTIFAAYRLYALLPPALTFVLLVVVVAGAGVLAVLQDALALAVLAIVGGFLAPILASNG